MKDMKKKVVLLAVSILFTLFLLELIGVIAYYRDKGILFYNRQTITKSSQHDEPPQFTGKSVLHPFLGFICHPGLPISQIANRKRLEALLFSSTVTPTWINYRANNFGFFSENDYPYKTIKPNDYVIGIFGGSVAHWFALQGSDRLRDRLSQTPAFLNKRIVCLNFGQGGFKQPQQLQTLTYFLSLGQRFDFILNIDGFNETILSYGNHQSNIATSMPSSYHVLLILNLLNKSSLTLQHLDGIQSIRKLESRIAQIEQRMLRNKSAVAHLVLNIFHRRTCMNHFNVKQNLKLLSKSSKGTDWFHLLELAKPYTPNESLEQIFELWQNSSITMQRLANSSDIPYLEVVQPNQYFTPRKFSAKEKTIALSDLSPYKEVVEICYPYIETHVNSMQEKGVHVISAVDIFDTTEELVYSDNTCHYNQIGNDILADFIANQIIALIEKQK